MSEPAQQLPVRPAPKTPAPDQAVALRHFLPLAVAVFTSGAVLLGLEIAASRVVAPYFGNSLFVWGALIGVVLAGLAVGYWLGGVVADRIPSPRLLTTTMAVGAALVLLVPLLDKPVLEAVVDWDPGPRLNPLLAAIALFGLPSVVFASVSPIGVRLVARSVATVGTTSGRLFAISTAGSIAGTFATAFVLIPEFGTNQLLGQAAAVLFAAVVVFAAAERLVVVAALAVLACVGATIVSFELAPNQGGRLEGAAAQNYSPVYRLRGDAVGADLDYESQGFDLLFRKDTQYHGLAVVQDENSRFLRFDSSFQSGMYVDKPFRTRFEYTDYLLLALAYKPDAKNVLFIGLGGGSAPKRMWRDFPNLQIDIAEIDPVVRDVAYRFFELPRSPRLRVEVEDGRRYLARSDRKWDAIIVDAYYADSIPFHLSTLEFQQLVRAHLKPGGVVASNIIGALEGSQSKLLRSFIRTYSAVFPTVEVHPVMLPGDQHRETLRNVILVAGDKAAPSEAFLVQRWNELRSRGSGRAPDLAQAIEFRVAQPLPVDDVPVLTDDYAPTDALLVLE
jgi:spermidine synthase